MMSKSEHVAESELLLKRWKMRQMEMDTDVSTSKPAYDQFMKYQKNLLLAAQAHAMLANAMNP